MYLRSERSAGTGIVEMESAQGAGKAIELLDGSELDGREIGVRVSVNYCTPCHMRVACREIAKTRKPYGTLPKPQCIAMYCFTTNARLLQCYTSFCGVFAIYPSIILDRFCVHHSSRSCWITGHRLYDHIRIVDRSGSDTSVRIVTLIRCVYIERTTVLKHNFGSR